MKKSSLYGLLATAVLLVGVSFLIYCGKDDKTVGPEGQLAQEFCHAAGQGCTYDTDCCLPTTAGSTLSCKNNGGKNPGPSTCR